MQILGLPTINATNLNHAPTKWKIDQSHLIVTLIINRKRKKTCRRCGDDWTPGHKCRNNETIQCKIINGKEVQVCAKEVSSDSNTDINQNEGRH